MHGSRYRLEEDHALTIAAAGHARVRPACSCGWRGPLCERPSGAARLFGGLHLRDLEAAQEATWCPNCRAPGTGGEVCRSCVMLDEIFPMRAGARDA